MNKYFLIAFALCAQTVTMAQSLSLSSPDKSGVNVVCYGDLNKDGIKDKVVVETPQNKSKMHTREDGYVYNFNQPVMSIYFGTGNGYKLFKTYNNVIPRVAQENESIDYDISITDQGVLRLAFSAMFTAGSWEANDYDYLYRYQDGNFYKIGEDYSTMMRNSGESTTTSFNYITHKKQVTKGQLAPDGDKPVKTSEKWSSIPSSPLEKLGAKNLKQ